MVSVPSYYFYIKLNQFFDNGVVTLRWQRHSDAGRSAYKSASRECVQGHDNRNSNCAAPTTVAALVTPLPLAAVAPLVTGTFDLALASGSWGTSAATAVNEMGCLHGCLAARSGCTQPSRSWVAGKFRAVVSSMMCWLYLCRASCCCNQWTVLVCVWECVCVSLEQWRRKVDIAISGSKFDIKSNQIFELSACWVILLWGLRVWIYKV